MQGNVVGADNTVTNRGGEIKGKLPKEVRISKNECERMDIILPDKQHGLAKEEGCGKREGIPCRTDLVGQQGGTKHREFMKLQLVPHR